MISATDARFPKSARLLKSEDFRFRPFRRYQSPYFSFFFTEKGSGRLGISLSKRVLKRASARNRVKRLVKEAFRHRRERLCAYDIHVVGRAALTEAWESLTAADIAREWDLWEERSGILRP